MQEIERRETSNRIRKCEMQIKWINSQEFVINSFVLAFFLLINSFTLPNLTYSIFYSSNSTEFIFIHVDCDSLYVNVFGDDEVA